MKSQQLKRHIPNADCQIYNYLLIIMNNIIKLLASAHLLMFVNFKNHYS